MDKTVSQDRFRECYQGRQGWLNHAAYLRLCKVFVVLEALEKTNQRQTPRQHIFDYGFGAGTLFRYLPKTWAVSGVELGEQTVRDVREMVIKSGFPEPDLQSIVFDENWHDHPLLQAKYDIIICSHVLEHLSDPTILLQALRSCLTPIGKLIAIVPINERRINPHHLQVVDRASMKAWADKALLKTDHYFETDPLGWILQPLLANDRGMTHQVARIISLLTGLPLALGKLPLWRMLNTIGSSFLPSSQACAIYSRLPVAPN